MSGHTSWRDVVPNSNAHRGRPGWAAHVHCAGDADLADADFEDRLVELVEQLLPVDGAVSASTAHDRYGATFSVYTDSDSIGDVVDQALTIFFGAARAAELPAWPVVRCEVVTFDEQDAELRAPNPN